MSAAVLRWVLGGWYVVGLLVWLWWPQKVVLVDIEAAQEPELAKPVYAQFVFTQTVEVSERERFSGLEVPLWVPEGGQSMVLRVTQGGLVIGEWLYEPKVAGVQVARLELERSVRVVGKLEVVIDGSHIAHVDKEQALAVFVEPDDNAYPDGNYRIAQNEKEGDIAMRLFSKKWRWQLLVADWSRDMSQVLFMIAMCVSGFVLVVTFVDVWGKTKR